MTAHVSAARPAPLFSPGFARDPHATYDMLREQSPVLVDERSHLAVLTRHADVDQVLRSPDCSASGGQQRRRDEAGVPRSMLTTDGAEHQALRAPAARLLGPAAVEAMLARLLPRVTRLWQDRAGVPQPLDLLGDLAEPLATEVLATVLAVTDDTTIRELDAHARAVQVNLDPMPRPEMVAAGRAAMAGLSAFLDVLMNDAAPGTPLRALVEDGRLPREDVRGILSLAVVGGWSPLAEVFTSLVRVVLTDPSAAAAAADPGRSRALLEDVLRWHSPIPFVARRATADLDLPSGTVPAGSLVLAMVGAANRDPAAFAQPDRVSAHPGAPTHLAFGAGAHFCMGAALIRGTVPAALAALLQVGVRAAAPASEITWVPTVFPRRVESIEVLVGEHPHPAPEGDRT
jgi:cytochrome P450